MNGVCIKIITKTQQFIKRSDKSPMMILELTLSVTLKLKLPFESFAKLHNKKLKLHEQAQKNISEYISHHHSLIAL
jgi:hypothetical protein